MTAEPGVRFGSANGLLVTTFLVAAVLRVDPTTTAWVAVITAGLLGSAMSLTMTAWLGVVAWAWFTGFVENRFGELTFAGDDVLRLAIFALTPVALAALAHRLHHMIKENAHGWPALPRGDSRG
jgi:hypothetical protein